MRGRPCGRRMAGPASAFVMAVAILSLAGSSAPRIDVVERYQLRSSLQRYLRPDEIVKLDLDPNEVKAEASWIFRQFPLLDVRVVMMAMPVSARKDYDLAGYPMADGKPLNGAKTAGAMGPGGSEVCVFGNASSIEAEAVAHELGRAFWHRLASSEDRAWYARKRQLHSRQDAFLSECFAEDSRLSFGSQNAKRTGHRYLGSKPPPGIHRAFRSPNPTPRIRYALYPGGASVFVEERQLEFPDLRPWLEGEALWVPVRPVAEALSWEVQYDPFSGWASLRRGQRRMQIYPGQGTALVDGREVRDLEFVLRDDRIAAPIDQVARLVDPPQTKKPAYCPTLTPAPK